MAVSTAFPLTTDLVTVLETTPIADYLEERSTQAWDIPTTSHIPVISVETVPEAVVDPNLEAAKELHFQAHQKALELLESKRVYIPEPLPYRPEEIPVQVTDSPEVAAAKAEHFTIHERFIKFLKEKEPVVPDLPQSTTY